MSRVDDAFTAILGWTDEDLVGHRLLDHTHPDDEQLAVDHWMETLADPDLPRRVRMRHQRKDGDWIWCEVTNHNRLADPAHGDVITEILDISEEMAALDAVRARESLLTQMADTIPVGLLQIDSERRVIYTNKCLREITGRTRAALLCEQLEAVVEGDRPAIDEAVSAVLASGDQADLELAIASERRRRAPLHDQRPGTAQPRRDGSRRAAVRDRRDREHHACARSCAGGRRSTS